MILGWLREFSKKIPHIGRQNRETLWIEAAMGRPRRFSNRFKNPM
jgi:hypothetical protein